MFSAKMNLFSSGKSMPPSPPTTAPPAGDDCNPALNDSNGYPLTCGIWRAELPQMLTSVTIEDIEGMDPERTYIECVFETDSNNQNVKRCQVFFTDSTFGLTSGQILGQRNITVNLSTGTIQANATGLSLGNNPAGFGCPPGTYFTGGGGYPGTCLKISCCGGPCAPSGAESRCGTCRLGNC